jgi:hypothetical protein
MISRISGPLWLGPRARIAGYDLGLWFSISHSVWMTSSSRTFCPSIGFSEQYEIVSSPTVQKHFPQPSFQVQASTSANLGTRAEVAQEQRWLSGAPRLNGEAGNSRHAQSMGRRSIMLNAFASRVFLASPRGWGTSIRARYELTDKKPSEPQLEARGCRAEKRLT